MSNKLCGLIAADLTYQAASLQPVGSGKDLILAQMAAEAAVEKVGDDGFAPAAETALRCIIAAKLTLLDTGVKCSCADCKAERGEVLSDEDQAALARREEIGRLMREEAKAQMPDISQMIGELFGADPSLFGQN